MKKLIVFSMLMLLLSGSAMAQPDTLWTQTYGGSSVDKGNSVDQTADGGYIIAGTTNSFGTGGSDVWLIKTDASGDTLWTAAYGGSLNEWGYSVQQTQDGGYIVAGYTESYGAGLYDVWLIKTDASGDTLWTRTCGGTSSDRGYSVQQIQDGGYIIAGQTGSFGAGGDDVWLIKTDASGDSLWTQAYGGSGTDFGQSVQQTDDGGYILAGRTTSFGAGSYDIYLIKTDESGNSLWYQTFGGSDWDEGYSAQQTSDGGYIITGDTYSYGAGGFDLYLIKTDSNGDTLWTQAYGGSLNDWGYSVQQTEDGGYIVAGTTQSYGTVDVYDVWLIKTDASGDTVWTQAYGGSASDYGCSVQQTTDGGYVIGGQTQSYGAGLYDFYLIRLEGEAPPDLSVTLTPHDPPIQIPATGGSFQFDLDIENTTAEAIVADAWVEITPPGGPVMPLIVRLGVTFPANTTISRPDLTQNIPDRAPAGTYLYTCSVGEVMGTIIDIDLFTFEKLAGDGGLSTVNNWNLSGWEDEVVQVSAPAEFSLYSTYPNPFNPLTTISYALPEAARISLAVYDLSGRLVASLIDGWRDAGTHEVCFDGSDLASGIYVYRLNTGQYSASGKMVLMK